MISIENVIISMVVGTGLGTVLGVIIALVHEEILNRRTQGGGIKPSATPPPPRVKEDSKRDGHF